MNKKEDRGSSINKQRINMLEAVVILETHWTIVFTSMNGIMIRKAEILIALRIHYLLQMLQ